MMRRHKFNTIFLVSCLSIFLIINIGTKYTDKAYCNTPNKSLTKNKIIVKVENGQETYTQQIPNVLSDGTNDATDIDNILVITNGNHSQVRQDKKNTLTSTQNVTHNLTYITKVLLEKARSKIKNDTSNYNFSQSGVHGLEDLVMEFGGQPLRNLVVSTWRSGSTFTGELIKNVSPSNYYQCEPLSMYEKQFRTPEEATEALSVIKRMLKCNFNGLGDYFEYERKHFREGKPSTKMWEYCKYENNDDLCFNADFTSQLCRLFPFQTMKLVRLRLRLVEEILDDRALNVKVILLVRDPRGVMQSRQRGRFCQLSQDSCDHSMLCTDMVSDYLAAGRLLQQYPDRLMVMRFEELALQPNSTSHQILKFLKIQRTKAFNDFLQSHTNVDAAGAHSTSRVSRNIPYKWRTALNFTYVNEIQKECRVAMRLWGYKLTYNETHMTSLDFNPVDDYTIS